MTEAERRQLDRDPVAFANYVLRTQGKPELNQWQVKILERLSEGFDRRAFVRAYLDRPGRQPTMIELQTEIAFDRLTRTADEGRGRVLDAEQIADIETSIRCLRSVGFPQTLIEARAGWQVAGTYFLNELERGGAVSRFARLILMAWGGVRERRARRVAEPAPGVENAQRPGLRKKAERFGPLPGLPRRRRVGIEPPQK